MALDRLKLAIKDDASIAPSQRLALGTVLATIEENADADGECHLIARDIAAMWDRDEGSISKLLKILEDKGLIRRSREGFPAASIIRLVQ